MLQSLYHYIFQNDAVNAKRSSTRAPATPPGPGQGSSGQEEQLMCSWSAVPGRLKQPSARLAPQQPSQPRDEVQRKGWLS